MLQFYLGPTPSFRSLEPREDGRHNLTILLEEAGPLVHEDPQLHLAPPNSERLGGAIVIPRFSDNLFSTSCFALGGGTETLLRIGKGLDTVLQVDLPLRELKEKILNCVTHCLIRVVTRVGGASGTCGVEAGSAKRTAARDRETGVCFDVETGVVEEEIGEVFDDSGIACEGEVRLLDPLEVCFSGSFLSGRKRKGVTGIVGDSQAACLTKGVLVGMYGDLS